MTSQRRKDRGSLVKTRCRRRFAFSLHSRRESPASLETVIESARKARLRSSIRAVSRGVGGGRRPCPTRSNHVTTARLMRRSTLAAGRQQQKEQFHCAPAIRRLAAQSTNRATGTQRCVAAVVCGPVPAILVDSVSAPCWHSPGLRVRGLCSQGQQGGASS